MNAMTMSRNDGDARGFGLNFCALKPGVGGEGRTVRACLVG